MSQWNVGIVGLSRGRGFVNVFGAHPSASVVALCDINEPVLADTGKAFKLPDAALFTDFDKFLGAPIDIVVVATPIRSHVEQTVKSLQSGKHVLCEQTAADSLEGCERIVQAVKKAGKAYMMAENYCYFHYIREWQKLVDAGKLGRIFYAEGEYIHNITGLHSNAYQERG